MSVFQAIVLGIVQGLTEFIPVSSTAHLRIVPALLGWQDPGAAFTAVIQLGTLVAVLAYFRRDIAQIAVAWCTETVRGQVGRSHDGRMGWLIIVGTVPIAVAGVLLKKHIEGPLRSLNVVAGAMIGVALVLVLAELMVKRWQRQGRTLIEMDKVSLGDAVVVGLAQTVALVPGSSRSGVTIAGALFRGLSREAAARFSFLLSLPAVFAAAVLELYSERKDLLGSREQLWAMVVCTVVSGIVGYASIAWFLAYLRKRTLYLFVVYRVILGLLLLVLVARGVLQPDTGAKKTLEPAAAAKR